MSQMVSHAVTVLSAVFGGVGSTIGFWIAVGTDIRCCEADRVDAHKDPGA
jgi:hypothetical protein